MPATRMPARLVRTVTADPALPAPQPHRLQQVWQGRLPLGLGFWLLGVLPVVGLWLGLDTLATRMAVRGDGLSGGSAGILLSALVLCVWVPLIGVVIWRSAERSLSRSGAPLWAWAARGVWVALSLLLFAHVVWHVAPRLGHYLRWVVGGDVLAALRIDPAADGSRLRLTGALGRGSAQALDAALSQHGSVWLLELDLNGGHAAEAAAASALARQRGLHTRVVGACTTACVSLYLSGATRLIAPGQTLRLHPATVPSANPLLHRWARRVQQDAWQAAGLSATLIDHVQGASERYPWTPYAHEWIDHGLVGLPQRPLEAVWPPKQAAAETLPAAMAEALGWHPVWQALDHRLPGVVARASAAAYAAHQAGADEDSVQAEAQQVLLDQLPRLLSGASAPAREAYVRLLADQWAALLPDQPLACQHMLNRAPLASRTLPLPLQQQWARWLIEVATEAPEPPRALTPLELEVVYRSLGPRAPDWLAGLVSDRGLRPPTCDSAQRLVAELLRLPAAQRRLATSLLAAR